jgi:hypothetical protein
MTKLSNLLFYALLVHGSLALSTLNIVPHSIAAADQLHPTVARLSGSVTLVSKTVIIPHGKKGQPYSGYKEATIHYPVVIGLKDPAIRQAVQTTISLKRVLGQSMTEMEQEYGGWLDEIRYTVNFNQNNILDLTYLISGTAAYPNSYEKRVSVNLRTGKLIQVKDLFKDDALSTIARAVDKIMQQEIQQKIAEFQTEEPDLAKTQLTDHRFQVKHLNDFNIGKAGVTFHYNFGFPHVIKAAEPSGNYLLSHKQLMPYLRSDGALSFLLGSSRHKY